MKLPKQVQPVLRNEHPLKRSSGKGVAPSKPLPDDFPILRPMPYPMPRPFCNTECYTHILDCGMAEDRRLCLTKKGAGHCINCAI
jgi:hypothetical protein